MTDPKTATHGFRHDPLLLARAALAALLVGIAGGVLAGPPPGAASLAECPRAGMAGAPDPERNDGPSRRCLGCHDGAIAPDVDLPLSPVVRSGRHGEHPVGVSYREAWERAPDRLRPEWEVRRVVQLPGGRVQCASCHRSGRPESHGDRFLTGGDRVCTTCHVM
jgi:hypothetical protein